MGVWGTAALGEAEAWGVLKTLLQKGKDRFPRRRLGMLVLTDRSCLCGTDV